MSVEDEIIEEKLSEPIFYTLSDAGFDTSVVPPVRKTLKRRDFLELGLRWKFHPGIERRWNSVGLSDEIEQLPRLSTPEMVRNAYIGNTTPLAHMVLGHIFPPPFAGRENSPVMKSPMWGSDKVNFIQTRSDFLFYLIFENLMPQFERTLGWDRGLDQVTTATAFERELIEEVTKRWNIYYAEQLRKRG